VRKAELFFRAGLLPAVACLAFVSLAGCGDRSQDSAGLTSIKAHKTPKKTARPGQDNLADMVAAVSGAKGGPPVEMKFTLTSRPDVGQVVDVAVALVPRNPVPESVSGVFQAPEGLEIVEGSQLDRVEKLTDGSPIHHVVKIRAKRDGIFTVIATVTYQQANQEFLRTFSIPVIAGEGTPEQVAKGP
jgi:hypothetical protein